MIHACHNNKTVHAYGMRTLMALCIAVTMSSTTTHAYKVDTIAAFFAPAFLTNYLSSKRTVAEVRAKAQTMIDDYEQHNGIFTVHDIRWAYEVVRSSDQELEQRLWWNNMVKSAIIGAFSALVYHSIMHPSKTEPTEHNHYYHSTTDRYPSDRCAYDQIAAPFKK